MPLTNQEREQLRYELFMNYVDEILENGGTTEDVANFINNDCGTGLMQKAFKKFWATMNSIQGA